MTTKSAPISFARSRAARSAPRARAPAAAFSASGRARPACDGERRAIRTSLATVSRLRGAFGAKAVVDRRGFQARSAAQPRPMRGHQQQGGRIRAAGNRQQQRSAPRRAARGSHEVTSPASSRAFLQTHRPVWGRASFRFPKNRRRAINSFVKRRFGFPPQPASR